MKLAVQTPEACKGSTPTDRAQCTCIDARKYRKQLGALASGVKVSEAKRHGAVENPAPEHLDESKAFLLSALPF